MGDGEQQGGPAPGSGGPPTAGMVLHRVLALSARTFLLNDLGEEQADRRRQAGLPDALAAVQGPPPVWARPGADRALSAPAQRRDDRVERIHQSRVAMRRIRSTLRTFHVLVDPRWSADLRADLSWYGTVLGRSRDLDLLARAAERRLCYVMVSVTTLDGRLSRILEPRAAAPWARLDAVRQLADAGVPVGVNVAPIIPFLNEPEIERIVEAAAQAGAHAIHYTIVRLPWEVNPLFQEWLDHHVPERAARIMARIRDLRGGRDYDARFGQRMKGQGVWGELIRQRVRSAAARHGLGHGGPVLDSSAFDPGALRTAALPAHQASARGDGDDGVGVGVQGALF